MTVWQYAQLKVTYANRVAAGGASWTIAWHGLGPPTENTAGDYGEVIAELNRAGTAGWELVDVATLAAGDSGHFRDWSLTRYTFMRPYDPAAAEDTEPSQREDSLRSQPAGTVRPAPPPDGNLAGSSTPEPVTLVRLTAYWQGGSADGRLLIRREARPDSQADIDTIEPLRVKDQVPGVSEERRDEIKDAAADYAASWVEGQFGDTWWWTPQSFPLSRADDLLDGSAEWLRGLVRQPLADAASTVGAAGPVVDIGSGVTANFVTAPLTAPLEGAARVFELTGIVIGLATGAHLLVMASAKLFAHDEGREALKRGFGQVISSIDPGRDRQSHGNGDTRNQNPGRSQQTEPGDRQQRPAGEVSEEWSRTAFPGPATRPIPPTPPSRPHPGSQAPDPGGARLR